jgi:hypothetical protein
LAAYTFIIVSAAVGYFNGPWWTALPCGMALASLSIAEQQKLRSRFAAVGSSEVLMVAGLAGFANALLIAGGAHVMGRAVSWIFPF